MSLTDKEKELAKECSRYTFDTIEFADLFLSRIREEQEAVGIVLNKHELPIGYDHRAGNVIWFNMPKSGKLFTTPPATLPSGNHSECDCEELVEVLKKIASEELYGNGKAQYRMQAAAKEAIADHAKRMKGY